MSNKLYSSHYINQQRSSGYKSTTYAMAEIVDNSVDANATNIKIILSEKEVFTGKKSRPVLNRIFFIDNGSGIDEARLNNCLTFAEGDGRNNKRIGAFGVGLPNSSVATCKRVEVYSRKKGEDWKHVFLDIDDQIKRKEPGYDDAIIKVPEYTELKNNLNDAATVIVWTKLDKIDVSRAQTLITRSERLLGRIYRYKLLEDLEISYQAYLEGKDDPIIPEKKLLPYDPLFIGKKETYITKLIWESAQNQEKKGEHTELGHLPQFNSSYYYKKYIEGCKPNESKPIFQKFDDYWGVEYKMPLNGKTYKWSIKASFAYKDITNPGIRSGGGTKIGSELGKKMSGDTNFKSGNIYFLRANREIDFGSFGLYTVTDEKNRFWSIEIHFDSDLDELMGLSNNKQSTQFKYVSDAELESVFNDENIPLGVQREILFAQMSEKIKKAISGMKKYLRDYARDFKNLENEYMAKELGETQPIQPLEKPVLDLVSTKNETWNKEDIEGVVDHLKSRYMSISRQSIYDQVEKYADGLTRTIVLYAPTENGFIFEIREIRGKNITLINTNHSYFTNIIEPLKSEPKLRIFASSIELFISSYMIEMDRLIQDNEEKYKHTLQQLLTQVSSRLNEYIHDSNIKLDESILNNLDLEE